MPFNDESLARAIAAMPVPVVSGIGHEPDTSIADMVADVRASTPTAAAEAAAGSSEDVAVQLRACATALSTAEERRLTRARHDLERMALMPLFREPMRLLEADAVRIDESARKLNEALPRMLGSDALLLERLGSRLAPTVLRRAQREGAALEGLRQRTVLAGRALPERFAAALARDAARLHDLSPLAVLGRGYAIVKDRGGRVVRSAAEVVAGDDVNVMLADGELLCKVEGKGAS